MARRNQEKLLSLVLEYRNTSSALKKNSIYNQIAKILDYNVKYLVTDFYVEGMDHQDIKQLCLIELWEMLEDGHYNPEFDFTSYALVRMRRNIINHLKRSRSKQSHPYKKQVQSLEEDLGGGPTGSFVRDETEKSPVVRVLSAERRKQALDILNAVRKRCSHLEALVLDELLKSYHQGRFPDYARIGAKLGIDMKSVDNARERIVRKCQLLDKQFGVFDAWLDGDQTELLSKSK